jgi:hypothetical protein
MKTIIIHQVQIMWNEGLKKTGTCFDEILDKVYHHLLEQGYDQVIITNFEANVNLDIEQKILKAGVYIYGAFYGGCTEDLEIALKGSGVTFEIIESLMA